MIPRLIILVFIILYIKYGLTNNTKHYNDSLTIDNYNKKLKLNGLEYLGLGYNIKESMPIGNDEDVLIDPGYKEPVISFERGDIYVEDSIGKDDKELPTGVWIRNESLCYKTFFVSKANRNKSIIDVLNEDIKINIISDNVYSSNRLNENLSHMIKAKHLNVFKLNCSIDAMGMILSYKWKLKESVLILLNRLDNMMKEDDSNNNNQDEEEFIKNSWYNIFNTYGSHVMTKITLGGKIIEINDNTGNSDKKEITKEDQRKLNLTIFKLNSSSDISNNEELLNKNKYEKIIVIGGSVNNDLYKNNNNKSKNYKGIDKGKWIKSIRENPIPIKFELTSLGYFIYQNYQNDKLLESFEKYLHKYLK